MRLKGCFPAGKACVPDSAEVSRQGNARRQAARPAGGEDDPSQGKPALPAGAGAALTLISIDFYLINVRKGGGACHS